MLAVNAYFNGTNIVLDENVKIPLLDDGFFSFAVARQIGLMVVQI